MQETVAAQASVEGHVTLAQETRELHLSFGSTSSGPMPRIPPTPGLQVLFGKKGYWSSALDSRCSTTWTHCAWPLGQQPLQALVAGDMGATGPTLIPGIRTCISQDTRLSCLCMKASGQLVFKISSSFINQSFDHKWSRAGQFQNKGHFMRLQNLLCMGEGACLSRQLSLWIFYLPHHKAHQHCYPDVCHIKEYYTKLAES